jgi:hypothetical protein
MRRTPMELLWQLPAVLLMLLACMARPSAALKLKFATRECLTHTLQAQQRFWGSYVSMPDLYSLRRLYRLSITSPNGTQLYDSVAREDTFGLVAFEGGRYSFCLTESFESPDHLEQALRTPHHQALRSGPELRAWGGRNRDFI